jgi:hypothetical protein
MGALRARGKLRTILDCSDITHEANFCFNLTLHDDLDGVLKKLRYMVDVRKNCGAAALIGVSNGAATLNFLMDEFKNLLICPCHVMGISGSCLGAAPDQSDLPRMLSNDVFPFLSCDPQEPSCTPYPPPPSNR